MDILGATVAYASVDSFIANTNRLIINPLIVLLFSIAMAVFLYGVTEFLMGAGNEEKRTEGKQHMIWGVVGITIMMGVYAILNIILRTFNLQNDIDVKQGTVDLKPYNPTYPPIGPTTP